MVVEARLRVGRGPTDRGRSIHVTGDAEHCLTVLEAESADALAADLERVPEDRILERRERSVVYRCACEPDGLVQTARALGVSVTWPIVEVGGVVHATVLADTRARVAALVEALGGRSRVDVGRVGDLPFGALESASPIAGVAGRLTHRQLDALRLAVARGYYRTPRATDTEDLAAAMGLARSTFQEHLRKAEAAVLSAFAETVAMEPALLEAPARGRGRPRKETLDGPAA